MGQPQFSRDSLGRFAPRHVNVPTPSNFSTAGTERFGRLRSAMRKRRIDEEGAVAVAGSPRRESFDDMYDVYANYER